MIISERFNLITAIQAVSKQTCLTDLATTVLTELMGVTNATGGFFFVNEENDNWVLKNGLIDSYQIDCQSVADAKTKSIIPASVFDCSCNTGQSLVINNALVDNRFATDPYFMTMLSCSVIAQPVHKDNKVIALIVLERRHAIAAFNAVYVEFTDILAKQIAISIDQIYRFGVLKQHINELSIDILAYKQSALLGVEREKIFHLIADNAPVIILLFDKKNHSVYLNQKLTDILGYQLEDISSLDDWWLQIFPDARIRSDNLQRLNNSKHDGTAFYVSEPEGFLVTCKNAMSRYIQFRFVSTDDINIVIGTEMTIRERVDLDLSTSIFNKVNIGIGIADRLGRIIKVNDRYAAMLGYTPEELVGVNTDIFSHPDDLPTEIGLYYQCIGGEFDDYHLEKRYVTRSGDVIWINPVVTLVRNEQGDPLHFIGVALDITERKKTEVALLASERRFRQLFEKAPLPLAFLTSTGYISHVNTLFIDVFGYALGDTLTLEDWWALVFPDPDYRCMTFKMWTSAVSNVTEKNPDVAENEYLITCKNGQVLTMLISGTPIGNDLLMLFMDITEQKQHQKKLEHIAHYDALTHLPNRVLLADRLNQCMHQSRRHGQHLAVVYLDLDGFKLINDNHGHEAGDKLLLTVATRMKLTLRDSDTIARLGGDEFVAVLFDVKNAENSKSLINRLLEAANQPVYVDGLVLQVSASLGVTFYSQHETVSADQLLRQADQAMYQAKLMGKNRYAIFDAELNRNTIGHHECIERIRLALKQNEFELYYQPRVNLRTGDLVGIEALIRWQHPEYGLLLPTRFLPTIENHPLIIELGEWVIEQALQQLEYWQDHGLAITISVNIAALQLQQTDFIERLTALMQLHPKVNAGNLELEILESSALADTERVSKTMTICREMGIHFALDDFGTGYSSLSYLKHLPVKILKIDKSFVLDMLNDAGDLAILEGILGLASASRREVIAEGVETIAHGEMLLQIGCVLAQGYGIARPMAAESLLNWWATWQPDPVWRRCRTFDRDEMPLLWASVEHRAWIKTIEEYVNGVRPLPPYHQHYCELTYCLQDIVKKNHDKFAEFQSISFMHKRLHELAAELFDLHDNARWLEEKAKMEELRGLSHIMDAQLKALLINIQDNDVVMN